MVIWPRIVWLHGMSYPVLNLITSNKYNKNTFGGKIHWFSRIVCFKMQFFTVNTVIQRSHLALASKTKMKNNGNPLTPLRKKFHNFHGILRFYNGISRLEAGNVIMLTHQSFFILLLALQLFLTNNTNLMCCLY